MKIAPSDSSAFSSVISGPKCRPSIGIRVVLALFFINSPGFAQNPISGKTTASSFERDVPEPITSLRQLRALSPAEAAQGIPVDVTGVITYFEIGRDMAMIQNEDGAAYVHFRKENGRIAGRPGLSLEPGDRVRLRGITDPGGFAPSIWHPESGNIRATKLGKAPLPEPMRLFPTVILDPPFDNHRVEVTGVVTDIRTEDGRTVVTFNDGYDDFDLLIRGPPQAEKLPEGLLNSRIEARGVYSVITDDQREIVGARFFLPSAEDIRIVERGGESVFAKSPLTYAALTDYRAVTGERLHVRGVVTASFPPDRLYLRMDDGPLEVRTSQRTLPPPGTKLGVVGYRGLTDGRPYLHTVALRPGDTEAPPQPYPVSIASPLASMRHGELVALEARLADTLVAEDHSLLLLNDGLNSFTARLPEAFDRKDNRRPPDGSWLKLTGILIQSSAEGSSEFRLHLRGFDDIEILRRPAFWTGPRIGTAFAALLLSIAALFSWSVWLRRKVRQQANVLATKFQSEKIQAERNRISRELHDTLEQDLVAIGIQLNLAGDHFATNAPTARTSLDAARRILRRTRMESRHSIQELREDSLLDDDIAPALHRMVERFQMDYDTVIAFQPSARPCRLPSTVRRQVLFILREAIHNAVKHASAKEITLRLHASDTTYHFEVSDDGIGFDPRVLPVGHFGLRGMRERAALIGADLKIQSAQSQCTRVHLVVEAVPSPPTDRGYDKTSSR